MKIPMSPDSGSRPDRWVETKLAEISRAEDRLLVRAYTTWALAAYAAGPRQAVSYARPPPRSASVPRCGWLDERQLGLGVLGQADIEAGWPPSRPRATTSGISSTGLPSAGWVTHLEVPVLASRTGTALEEERRW
jgi:hypothetical protein